MTHIHRTAYVPYSCEQMFALVSDVPSYPKFIDLCVAGTILERSDEGVRAALEFRKAGLHYRIVTHNRENPPYELSLQLLEGPFRSLLGRWSFTPIEELGCRVDFEIDFEVRHNLLGRMVAPMFKYLCEHLVQAFSKRALELYGDAPHPY